jgi:hypothetical protein
MMTLLFVPVAILYLGMLKWLPFEKPVGLRRRTLLPLLILVLLGFVFILFDAYRYTASGASMILNELNWFFAKPIDDPFRLVLFTLLAVGIPLAGLAFLSGVYLLLEKSRPGLLLFLGAVVPFIIIIVVNPFMFTKERYVFMTLPCWVILAAVGIRQLYAQTTRHGKVIAVGVLCMLMADMAGAHLLYYTVNHGGRYDWKSAFTQVETRKNVNDLVVSTRPEIGAFYYDGNVIEYVGLKPEEIARGNSQVWFIVDSEKIWNNRPMKKWLEENGELVDFQYLRIPEELNLRIYRYKAGDSAQD